MKWIEEAGLALIVALLLHAVWRQQQLHKTLQKQETEPPPPAAAPMPSHGFVVAPWEP
jgi:hypothetical protein